MNHPYPDNYHGGYARGGPAGMQQQGMGYGHGGYDNPASMARMGHLRHGYNPMTQQYGDSSAGQMHPMLQQPQHPGGAMYSPHAGYMGQMGGASHYGGMGSYPGYGNMPGAMNHGHPGMSHSMGPGRGQQHPHGSSMMGSGGNYYNNHPLPHHHQQHHQHAATNQIPTQQPTPPPNYGHQSPNSVPKSSTSYGQQPNQSNSSQATHHHHPSPHNANNMQGNGNNNAIANHSSLSSSSSSSVSPTTTQTYNMPITTQASITNNSNNILASGQQPQMVASPQNNNGSMMIPNSHSHSQSRPSIGSMSAMGGGNGGAAHPIPQHPMRHPTTQQSPQEVADNILQIASSYPTNQTVQVPLKGQSRHAPYHIPRSPHHFNSSSSCSSSTSTPSSMPSADNYTTAGDSTVVVTSNHFQQQQHPAVASPPVASSLHQAQPNMSPSTSSSVKSPNPALAPIPNPIPSPGISGIRSPSSSHCLSPCSSQQQRSPSQMAASSLSSSSYSGHNQPAPSPSSTQHYSPISGGGTPQHHSATFVHSPPSYHPSPNSQPNLSQSTVDNQSMYGNYSNMNMNVHHHHQHQQSSSPYTGNNMTSPSHSNIPSSGQYSQHHQHQPQQQCGGNGGNNPLMSLQKLVMLPETQVVDPKSVVNDACLAAASANETHVNTDSKNCEGPAERFAESSGLSVGSSGQLSSLCDDDNQLYDTAESQTVMTTDASSSHKSDTTVDTTANDLINGEGASSSGVNHETNSHFISSTDAVASHDEKNNDDCSQGNEIMGNETTNLEIERLLNHHEDEKSFPKTDLSNMLEIKEENVDSDRNLDSLLQQASSDASDLLKHNSGNKIEDWDENKPHEEIKTEKPHPFHETPNSDELLNESFKPLFDDVEKLDAIVSAVSEGKELMDGDDSFKESENASSLKKKDSSLSPVKKDDDAQCELKQVLPESKSPSVLSEVQVVVNGNHVASNTEEEDEEVVEDEECNKITRARLRNGLKSVVRSKIGKTAKKASQFLRLTTPCSIAVGADEREVCEQFAFRRNGYCHALRASRLLYNGRGRQDSTSHGDSDESVENISDTSLHNLGTPQDGSKKKNVGRKNVANQSNSGDRLKATSKESIEGKRSKNNNGGCSNVSSGSNVKESDFGSRGNSHENKELSDEDGEICYYEGVDSTEFFMNNNSSDDSFSSSPDSKQKKQEATPGAVGHSQENSSRGGHHDGDHKGVDSEQKDDRNNVILSPPTKRVRRFPPQKQNEVVKKKIEITKDDDAVTSHVLSNGMDSANDVHTKRTGKELCLSTTKLDENSSDRENGKVVKTRMNRRKQVFGKLLVPEEQMKLPDVLMKLEKSESLESSRNNADIIDLTDSSTKEENGGDSGSTEKLNKANSDEISAEKTDGCQEIKVEEVKAEDQESVTPNKSQITPSKLKGTPTKRKRPAAKKKQKGIDAVVLDKEDEVRDSFKSMKFGRTLDMMKSQRKKEQGVTGPFIRVIGNRTAPKTVSLMNQSTQNQIASISGKQNQKSSSKLPVTGSAAISMVSCLSSDKTALVTSSKTVSHQTWFCAFCNHQSSYRSLGDLFGPYYKEGDIPKVEHLAMEEAKRAKDNDKKGQCSSSSLLTSKPDKKGKALLKADKKAQKLTKASKKGSLSSPPSSSKKGKFAGDSKEESPQEVWVHQACALWAPGVYVIRNKLYGMEEAMKDAADSICSSCKEKGAMIGCLHRGCAMKYHISCAIDQDCCLDEENLSLLCPKHKDKKVRISSASTSALPFS